MFRWIALKVVCLFLLYTLSISAQNNIPVTQKDFISVPSQLQNKIGSGRLIMKLSEKNALMNKGILKNGSATAKVVIYFLKYPTQQQIHALEQLGLTCYLQTWTPPLDNHPLGFIIAELPIEKLNDILSLDYVRKLDTAEGTSTPLNNNAAKSIKATAAWTQGWTGKGIKIGVLDSGIHADSADADLPAAYEKKDYSLFPQLDDDVRNKITGHGTHVTGIILGRGTLSSSNIANGGGAYKGMAPEAGLAFFKIGDDTTANASDAAIIAALNDAVSLYHVKVINMSYGGWGPYHDGSEPVDQKADWCYSQGVAVAFAAGNSAQSARHFMGTVPANGESDFIQVNVNGADSTKTRPSFNLIWYDGVGTRNNLTLKYYDGQKNEILNVNHAVTTESPRGTESQFSSTQQFASQGNSVYYLKVANASNADQLFHIYEDYTEWSFTGGSITFQNPAADYTIGSPSTADHVLSVAAYVSRSYWVGADGGTHRNYQTLDKIASFSSRGPRVDGKNKPDIAAPGSALISIRDRDIFKSIDGNCVDNDGAAGGDANYYVMQGTSMATPVCTGALALLLGKYPSLTPQQAYDSLRYYAKKDAYTGSTPNPVFGIGKLDLSFLSGLHSSVDGWYQINASGWNDQGIPAVTGNAQGDIFVNVGKPWTTDASTIYKSTDEGYTWMSIFSAPSLSPLAILQNGTLFTAGRIQGLMYRSINNGNTWTSYGTAHDYTSISITPDDSVVASTYGQGIFYSNNNGTSWSAINDGLPANAQVPLVIASWDRFYALVMTNGIVRLYGCNRNYQWKISDSGIDTTKNVNACAVMPDGTVFAAVSDRIYRSIDKGASWQQVTILNDYLQYLYALSNSTIFVGTVGGGVYRSTDKGNNWSSFSDGLTTLNIAAIGGNGNGMLYAGADREKVFKRKIGVTPAKINLIEPLNNAAQIPVAAAFRWTNDSNALTYWLQVSSAQDFSTLLINQQDINLPEWQASIFQPLTKYYWRVCAANNGGSGSWSDSWNFTTAIAPPPTPTLVQPANGAADVSVNLTFQWNPFGGSTTYHIQISVDSTFSPLSNIIEGDNLLISSYNVQNLRNSTKYYWRVYARNAGGASLYSEIWSFTTIMLLPSVPVLSLPKDTAKDVSIYPDLVWNSSSDASTYSVQVGVDANFMPPLVFSQSGIVDTTVALTGLAANTKYYWRVNASRGLGTSAWSAVWSFTTILAPPLAPSLLSPNDNATNIVVNPILSWNASATAASYRLQVSLTSSFITPVIDQTGITSTSFSPSGLLNNTKYYWRVNAANAGGTSNWSTVWSFTTLLAPPLAPSLFSPVDNAVNIAVNPALNWNAAANATTYQLQVSLSSNFTTPIIDQTGIVSTSFSPSGLLNNTKYYWRVNASNAGGASPWSAIWSFTTTPQTAVRNENAAEGFYLGQNYPNPFSQSTAISYRLAAATHVQLEVLDIFGRTIAVLVDEEKEAGEHTSTFFVGRFADFRYSTFYIPQGMYIYQLHVNGKMRAAKTMVVVH